MATEQVVEKAAETVAESLEEAAFVTRRINPRDISLVAGGLGLGLVIGFVIGWRLNRAKIYAEAYRQSEEEVEKIREMYREATAIKLEDKPALEAVIQERGYATTEGVLPADELEPTNDSSGEVEVRLRAPVPIPPTLTVGDQPEIPTIRLETGKSKDLHWDAEEELASRTPDRPYIIHEDEFSANETDYRQETLTWYAEDGVLTDENEDKIEAPDDIVGLDNLNKFGHGSGDYNVLFVRNDAKNMEYEISRMHTSYAEEVLGITNEPRE